MFVGALRATYRLRGARSLKEKRAPLRSLKERVRNRFGVSVAEVDAQDRPQRVVLGVSLVAESEARLREQMQAASRYLEGDPNLELLEIQPRIYGRFDQYPADESGDDDEAPEDLLFVDL
jgi:hypothetical protein